MHFIASYQQHPYILSTLHSSASGLQRPGCMAGRVSLGAVLWDGPPAEGHTAPEAAAPDAVKHQVSHSIDEEGCRSINISCRAGQTFLRHNGPRTVPLQLDPQLDAATAYPHIRATVGAVIDRNKGGLRSKMGVHVLSARSLREAQLVRQQMKFIPAHVRDDVSQFHIPSMAQTQAAQQLVQQAAQWFTKLRALTIPEDVQLPPNTQLQQVAKLTVSLGIPQGNIRDDSGVSEYTGQLRELVFDGVPAAPPNWPSIIHSHSTLSVLTTQAILDDRMLYVLLNRAPNLTRLGVAGVEVDRLFASKEWSVAELRITPACILGSCNMCGSQLHHLPRSRHGRLVAINRCWILECVNEALDPLCVQQLAQCVLVTEKGNGRPVQSSKTGKHYTPGSVYVRPRQLPHNYINQPTLGLQLLHQLRHLQARQAHILVEGFLWTADTFGIVASQLPTLSHLRVSFAVDSDITLNDTLMGVVGRMQSYIHSLRVKNVELDAWQAVAVWPFGTVVIDQIIDSAQLVKLPLQAGTQLTCHGIIFGSQMSQEDALALSRGLPTISFTAPAPEPFIVYTHTYNLAFLTMLRSLSVKVQSGFTLMLAGPITEHELQLFEWLPTYSGAVLDVTRCTWPLAPECYVDLAKHVPECYRVWKFSSQLPGVYLGVHVAGSDSEQVLWRGAI